MKLNQVKVRVITAPDAATLETNVNAFLSAATERTYLSMDFMLDTTTTYAVLIVYTE